MAQVKVDKDRSYRLGGGKALDAYNERLADEQGRTGAELNHLHPTKGFRSFSPLRQRAQVATEHVMQRWAIIAAKITGSRVGGEPRHGTGQKRARLPHQGARECARRRGDLKRDRAMAART